MRFTLRALVQVINTVGCQLDEVHSLLRGTKYYQPMGDAIRQLTATRRALNEIYDAMCDEGYGE